ncbi:MAG: hypothetical protein R3D45_09675 [Rhizobiaceae bacterium]
MDSYDMGGDRGLTGWLARVAIRRRAPFQRRLRAPARLMPLAAAVALGACTTLTPGTTPKETAPPVQIDMAALPGNYGLASYHRDEDRDRTLEQAKIACNNPYTIGAGPSGGVMMHALGQSVPSEIFLKTDSKGLTYLGPRGPAGTAQDRHVVSYEGGVLTLRWMDPRARTVYGTMVYVPCGQA